MEMLVPVKYALMETPEYENRGASGTEKSIRPGYSISGSVAGMVSAAVTKQNFTEISTMNKLMVLILI